MLFNNNENKNAKISYRRIRQFVYNIIRKRVANPEDADDITQDVLVRGWQSNERNADRLKFATDEDSLRYFCKIAFNELKRFHSNQAKIVEENFDLDKLFIISTELLDPQGCLEVMEAICGLPLKQRLTLILGHKMLLISFRKVFSIELIAEMLDMSHTLLEKLANEIPLDDKDIKYVIETMTEKELKTTVRDERWKGRKSLKGQSIKAK